MKNLFACCSVALALISAPGTANAGVVFSNFPVASGQRLIGPNFGAVFAPANQFTATGGGTLSSIDLALNNTSGSTAVIAELHADASTFVGALLSTGTVNATPALSTVTVTMTPTAIASGTPYWVVLRSIGANLWHQSGVVGRGAVSVDDGASFISYFNTSTQGAFRVNTADRADTAAIPEPGSLALLSAGALGLAVARLRRRGA